MRWAGAFLALWLAVAAAFAQETTTPNFDRWEDVASRAEETLAGALASDLALTALRAELVRFRTAFAEAQDQNTDRIRTAEEQLSALGETPEGGEAEDIAERRAELEEQLTELRAPSLRGIEAFERADGLIREIDSLIRNRRTEALLDRGPVPVDPTNWPIAFSEVNSAIRAIISEVEVAASQVSTQTALQRNLPAIVTLTLLGAVLIGGAGRLTRRAQDFAAKGAGVRSRALLTWLSSLLYVVLPLLGVAAILEALSQTGLLGFRGAHIAESIPRMAQIFFGVRWLALQVIPIEVEGPIPLRLDAGQRLRARQIVMVLVLSEIALILVDRLDRFDDFAAEAQAVLTFPIVVLAAICLVILGRFFGKHSEAVTVVSAAEGEVNPRSVTFSRAMKQVLMAIGTIGIAIGLIGYIPASLALVFPAAMTLGLLGALWVLRNVVGDLYILLTGASEDARDGLIPVLIGLLLSAAALPVLALIWGARWVEIAELWARLSEGVSLGETRISVSDFLTFVLVFAAGFILTRGLQSALRTSVLPKTRIDVGGQTAIVSGIGYVGIFLAALVAITTTGIDLSSIAIVAGALSVGIGFGLQNIVSNFVSGIILLIERPVSEGDWIEVGGHMGYVKDISVRSTRIETFDRTDVIVPNTDLVSGAVTNWTRGNTVGRVTVPVGVAYGTDTRWIETILLEIANDHDMVLKHPAPSVIFKGFGADSLDFEIRAFLRDVNWVLKVRSDMNHAIAQRFTAENIEIPFAQRDIWLRNPESLKEDLS